MGSCSTLIEDLPRRQGISPDRVGGLWCGSRWAGLGHASTTLPRRRFFTLEHEVLSRHRFTTRAEAREVLVAWRPEF
jgi:hypothetical protein